MPECEAVFDPDKWRHEFGIDPVTEDNVECSKEQIEEGNYCKYHSESKDRKASDINDVEVFKDLLYEQEKVFEPVFQSLTIEDINFELDSNEKDDIEFDLIHPIVEDKFEIKWCSFDRNLTIVNGKLGNTEVRYPISRHNIEFRKSVITGNLHIFSEQTNAEFSINQTDIYGHTEISSTFENEFLITGSRFNELVYIQNSTFIDGLDLSDSEFWEALVIDKSEIKTVADFHSIATDFLVYISECDIENINLDLKSCFDNLIRIYYSEIDAGTLRQQKQGTTYFDISFTTLGDVDIIMNTEDLSSLHLYDCDYTNFDFTQIRNQLEQSNWCVHDFGIDWGLANLQIRKKLSSDISKVPHRTYIDQFHMRNYVETYIKAKERASRQGDSQSASEFLINEMRAKKKKRSHNFQTSNFGWDEKVDYNINQAKNIFLDYSCGFGEKPWKAAAWALGIPTILGTIVFPLFGGVENSDTGRTFAFSLTGQYDPILGFEVILKNLYFSILSFSTIGSNHYVPATTPSHILMAAESLIGPFLVALFVFTLGKQVTR